MRQVIITGDGSPTVSDSTTGEYYHSIYGAVTESLHVFIIHGFRELPGRSRPLQILEIGFGTGLNAFLTLLESERKGITVHYEALEPCPLGAEITGTLDYPGALDAPEFREAFNRLHDAEEGQIIPITPRFFLNKIRDRAEQFVFPPERYDLVYFDAFSPKVQPELWQPAVFENLYAAMREDGLLLTYCSKGDVSRAMKGCGFQVGKLPGPPGKRHMLRGRKQAVSRH